MHVAAPLLRRSGAARRLSGCVTLHAAARAGPAWGLLRRRSATTSAALDEPAGPHPLQCCRAGIKSRSLAPDDPFGERGAWEDPSDGVFAAWNGVDQEGFVHAADSQEVRQAHFGPEWARFTTVGRMSVKKMREEQQQQQQQQQQHGDAPPAAAEPSAPTASAAASTPARRYPTAEELHEADLQQRRRLMQRNYTSYEAFVEHELGGGGDGESVVDGDDDGALGTASGFSGTGLYSAASMESAFSEVDGVDGRDRMAQRNLERAALDTVEAAEVEEEMSLPPFMREAAAACDDAAAAAITTTAAMPTTTPPPPRASPVATEITRQPRPGTPDAPTGAAAASAAIPAAFARQVLDALGAPHGDARLPLTDPMHWETEDVIAFLTLMEQQQQQQQPSSGEASPTMDETMCDTFRMARVTGDMLLNVVVPPRLFRLMRRWHVRRQDVVSKAWKRHGPSAEHLTGDGSGGNSTASAAAPATLAQSRERLAEAVQQLDRTLIQETILLCFPYGH